MFDEPQLAVYDEVESRFYGYKAAMALTMEAKVKTAMQKTAVRQAKANKVSRVIKRGKMSKSIQAPRVLVMQYAGSTVKHLGSQMYSGLVESVAELIANAYDADAEHVNVKIPFGSLLDQDTTIEVNDDGGGMTFDDCNKCFLIIGRDRRTSGSYTPKKNRRVMGRKGLGKLACFGISSFMEVATVKDGWATHFAMDYDAIMK
ncbi:MAG TPA: ATP-binding protein, partial [Anaerolineae bacterium]